MKCRFLLAGCFLCMAAAPPPMQGDRLLPGATCYAIKVGGKDVGATWQDLRQENLNGRPVWDIVVHQKMFSGRFDMRDHFVVDRVTLLPIEMDSARGREKTDKGWHRVRLHYDGGRVSGEKETPSGIEKISVTLDGPTWDGNLWGVTFAALPLSKGGTYTLPVWQYDKGKETFTVRVVGEAPASQEGGAAWLLDAGDDPSHLVRYEIGKSPRAELRYHTDGFSQDAGGMCAGMERP